MSVFKTVTFWLILVNMIIFFAEPKDAYYEVDLNDQFNQVMSFTPSQAFGMPWTFVTSQFMHANLEHIFFNMFTLLMFGLALESRIGKVRFASLYIAAGVLGNLVYMWMAYSGSFPLTPDTIGLGASGAIMGVLGTLGVIAPRISMYVPIIPIPVPMFVGVILFAAFNVLVSFVPSGIGTGAHLGGLALGVLYGFWLRREIIRHQNQTRVTYTYE